MLRTVLEVYPVAPVIQIICGLVCAIPSILLLTALLRSSIHANCRILLCAWVTAQLLVYATVIWLSIHYIRFEEKFFKDLFDPTGTVMFILRCYEPCWLICTCFELGISLERGFSILNPCKYYQSSTSYVALLLFFLFSVFFSWKVSDLLLSGSQQIDSMIGAVLSNLMDIGSFLTNIIVLLFARRKNNDDHKQLNERYQASCHFCSLMLIRETYTIARAMLPVYSLSTALKLGIIIFNWLYVTSTVAHTLCEIVYLCFSELSCGLTSTMFLLYHVRLRSNLCRMFGQRISISVVDKSDDNTIENHFQLLSIAWNK